MQTRVKICGITNLEDALASVEAGADALGFIFFDRSPRHMTVAAAQSIIRALPPFITKVGVFVDAHNDQVQEAITSGLSAVQFHGNESPDYCAQFDIPIVKAFRVKDAESLDPIEHYRVSALLLDSYVPGQLGGTGERFNWDLAVEARRFKSPIILAGGLTSLNVRDAVAKVQPYAVDVSSGVETSPRKKDWQKVKSFIAAAKSALD